MEYIKKEELIEGEIYNATISNDGSEYIFKPTENFYNCININKKYGNHLYRNGNFCSDIFKFSQPTPEEKHWLNCCIKLDKFITFEEAMKSFIPEYVECIKEEKQYGFYGDLGKIYKVDNWNHSQNDCMLIGTTSGSTCKNRFKPSTKEAYDAQFVVKEPEFILPERWCMKVTNENRDIINKLRNKIGFSNIPLEYKYTTKYHYAGNCTIRGEEITFEQFKKYVLKEEIVEEKVIEPLPQFKIIESIETITKVENNEGNQFFIGDVVKSDSGVVQTIESFNYNKTKTNIIAFTNKQSILGNGIGIDKIEHYIEPKVEIKDDFILPEKWCIEQNSEIINNWLNVNRQTSSIYNSINQYQMVHFPAKNGAHLYRNIQEEYVKITLDQFKKYVLKEEIKEESLLEKAKRLYPIGTKFKAARGNKGFYKVKSNSEFRQNDDGAICIQNQGNGTIYFNNEWAEIIKE